LTTRVGESIEKIGDCVIMLYSGEDVGDAAIKTGGHLLIQLALGSVGGPIGLCAGVGLSIAFDYLYDKYGDKVVQFAGDVWNDAEKVVGDTMKSVGDTAEKIWYSVGDAVNGLFSGLGSVF